MIPFVSTSKLRLYTEYKNIYPKLKETAAINAYLNVAGLPELREEIVGFHKEWDGVSLEGEGLVVGPGSKVRCAILRLFVIEAIRLII